MANNNQIFVERETYEKNGKTYFTYFIKGTVRGKDVRVAVVPPDKGGYAVLDIVFGDQMSAQLVTKPFEIKDDATGKVISGNTYIFCSKSVVGTRKRLLLFAGCCLPLFTPFSNPTLPTILISTNLTTLPLRNVFSRSQPPLLY